MDFILYEGETRLIKNVSGLIKARELQGHIYYFNFFKGIN